MHLLNKVRGEENSHMQTTFDKHEIEGGNDDYETEEEEEYDEAMAVPTFYKYQRRQKLNQEQNRLKFIHLAVPTTAFSKLTNSNATTATTKKTSTRSTRKTSTAPVNKTKLHKPKPRRNSSNVQLLKTGTSLIITFSENRKDTLRSAVANPDVEAKKAKLGGLLAATVDTVAQTIDTAATSAFHKPAPAAAASGMKQQSLLDMLKQRKRKTVAGKGVTDKQAPVAAPHNLRPRTISMN